MTIQVVSNDAPLVGSAPAAKGLEETKSVPVAHEAAEQKESSVSETEETEAEDVDDEASESESNEEEGNEEESQKDKPKKKSGSQRRKERAERAEAEVERLRGLVEEMARKGAGDPTPDRTDTKIEPSDKPTPDSFDTHSEYVEALTDWKIEQREKAAAQEKQRSQLLSEQEQLRKSHSERVKSFSEKTDDFEEVLESVDDIPVSPAVAKVILKSENGPELMYELAKNREEFERINRLDPTDAALELGVIKARLTVSETKKPEPKKTTNAPKPIEPVGGGKGAVAKAINDPTLSQAEYEAIRRKQIAARKSW